VAETTPIQPATSGKVLNALTAFKKIYLQMGDHVVDDLEPARAAEGRKNVPRSSASKIAADCTGKDQCQ
jgi:hypothetical protein